MQRSKHNRKDDKAAEDDFDVSETIMIYLQKDEEVFVKYGDEEADLYYKLQEMEKENPQEKRPGEAAGFQRGEKGGKGRRDNRERKYNEPVSVDEAKQLGLNFRDAPPKFKNEKKGDDKRTVTDSGFDKKSTNLREVINDDPEAENGSGDKQYQVRQGGNKNRRGGYND